MTFDANEMARLRLVAEQVFGGPVGAHDLSGISTAMFSSLADAWPNGAPPKCSDPLINFVLANCRVSETGCWEWQGASNKSGYGRVRVNGRLQLPHRVVAAFFGIIPEAADTTNRRVCVLHECDNPRCCNPDHLKAGSMSQNMKDCVRRGRHKRPNSPNPLPLRDVGGGT
jgi:hypothetical protein